MAESENKTETSEHTKPESAGTAEEKKPNEKVDVKQVPSPEVPHHRHIALCAFGGTKHVHVESVEDRKPGKNEVEIEVEACGVNFLDIMGRQGLLDQPIKPPFTMGSECAGIVHAVGDGVKKYKVGDKVVVLMETGAWSERLVLPVPEEVEKSDAAAATSATAAAAPSDDTTSESRKPNSSVILPWPSGLTGPKASIIAFAYLPAYILLNKIANVHSGDVVLVHSAGGGVGSAIGQLAKQIPNVKLLGTASAHKHEKLTSFYGHLFTPDQDCVAEIRKLYPKGIDVILDCLSGEDMNKSYGLLKPLGKYILYGMSNLVTGDRKNFFSLARHWFHVERINPLRLHDENRMLGGFSLKSLLFPRQPNTHDHTDIITGVWKELTHMIEKKQIDPWIDSEWGFDEIKEAMMRLQERKNIGKVVLLPKKKPKPTEQPSQHHEAPEKATAHEAK
ncbi:unnamed protein product [Calicophoron daubneyi]|uniref:Enoyl reductase (ER) domain-containing protein n=1 Tax=Calicophoron daubneyi TaxID=300641 RepID=A0AAV2TK23_CALDB